MDFKVQAEKMGLEEEEYMEIVNLFIQTTVDNLGQIRSAVKTGDVSKIREEAHSLKGAALNLGFWEICEIADRMTKRVRENCWQDLSADIEMIQGRVDQIADTMGKEPGEGTSRGGEG